MGFTCGLVGLPNVGKSTLFNALTSAGAKVSNYPFCTIDPFKGIVPLPDPRLERLSEILGPEKTTPTALTFIDIAGLVEGASRGEGLGNRFLGHVREVDAIAHVVRCFDAEQVSHVYENPDPKRDVEVVDAEMVLADLEVLERRIAKLEKEQKSKRAKEREDLGALRAVAEGLRRGEPARAAPPAVREAAGERDLQLVTSKPVFFVANVGGPEASSEKYVGVLRSHAAAAGAEVVEVDASLEAELSEMPRGEREEMMRELGIEASGLERIVAAGYRILGLVTFYTTVGTELRAWTVPVETPAPQAAGRIHTDMEKGFIRAEVAHFGDFDRLGSIAKLREAGLIRSEGRDYTIQDGDIVEIRFN